MGLANDGQGMNDQEIMITLSNSLLGSKRKILDNIVKIFKDNGTYNTDAGAKQCYEAIKKRMMKFLECDRAPTPSPRRMGLPKER